MRIFRNIAPCWETTGELGKEEFSGFIEIQEGLPLGVEDPGYEPHQTDVVLVDGLVKTGATVIWDNLKWAITNVDRNPATTPNTYHIHIERLCGKVGPAPQDVERLL
jgi:hypothetical protein